MQRVQGRRDASVSGLAWREANEKVGEGGHCESHDFREADEVHEGMEEGDAGDGTAGSKCRTTEEVWGKPAAGSGG